jgi:hypothetical protein
MSGFNDRYNHLLNKARQAMRFGRTAWAVQLPSRLCSTAPTGLRRLATPLQKPLSGQDRYGYP